MNECSKNKMKAVWEKHDDDGSSVARQKKVLKRERRQRFEDLKNVHRFDSSSLLKVSNV